MAAPDLTNARRTVAGLMPDTCTVTRNPGGVDDDTLDPDTMQLDPGETAPWYDGPCILTITGGDELSGPARVALPFDFTGDPDLQLRRGDVVHCTTSLDASLVGRDWAVDQPTGGSFAVTRQATLTEPRE